MLSQIPVRMTYLIFSLHDFFMNFYLYSILIYFESTRFALKNSCAFAQSQYWIAWMNKPSEMSMSIFIWQQSRNVMKPISNTAHMALERYESVFHSKWIKVKFMYTVPLAQWIARWTSISKRSKGREFDPRRGCP